MSALIYRLMLFSMQVEQVLCLYKPWDSSHYIVSKLLAMLGFVKRVTTSIILTAWKVSINVVVLIWPIKMVLLRYAQQAHTAILIQNCVHLYFLTHSQTSYKSINKAFVYYINHVAQYFARTFILSTLNPSTIYYMCYMGHNDNCTKPYLYLILSNSARRFIVISFIHLVLLTVLRSLTQVDKMLCHPQGETKCV